MRPKTITVSLDPADRNGVSVAQTTSGADAFDITGALASGGVATMDSPRYLSLYSTGNISGVDFVIVGTDRFGNAITETITGPNAGFTYGTYNYNTVTSVTPDGAVGTNTEVGSADHCEGAWVPVDTYDVQGYSIYGEMGTSANLDYTVEFTHSDIWNSFQETSGAVFNSDIVGASVNEASLIEGPCRAIRLSVKNHIYGDISLTIIHQR